MRLNLWRRSCCSLNDVSSANWYVPSTNLFVRTKLLSFVSWTQFGTFRKKYVFLYACVRACVRVRVRVRASAYISVCVVRDGAYTCVLAKARVHACEGAHPCTIINGRLCMHVRVRACRQLENYIVCFIISSLSVSVHL